MTAREKIEMRIRTYQNEKNAIKNNMRGMTDIETIRAFEEGIYEREVIITQLEWVLTIIEK